MLSDLSDPKQLVRSSDTTDVRVVIPHSVQEKMFRACEQSGGHETGGIVVGFYSADLTTAHVVDITLAPPGSRGGRTWFSRGIKGLRSLLRTMWSRDGHHYLGEWHSQPGASSSPSTIDSDQMAITANDEGYSCPNPILVIVGGSPDTHWSIYTGVYFRDQTRLVGLDVDNPAKGQISS